MKDHLIFDTTDATTMADTDSVGAYLRDAAGNLLTSQLSGAQQALDVGINVAGVQIDPRQIRALTSADVVTVDQGTSPWVVSGTVAVTQSTSPWITSDLADGSSTGGTAGTKSALAGGIYNTVPPVLTNGQQVGLQTDVNGNLKVDLVTPVTVNTDINGIYNGVTNPIPSNVGLIASSRAAPGLANQTLQLTGGALTTTALSGSNIVAEDVNSFGMIYNGTTWDAMTGTGGSLNVNVTGSTGTVTVSDAALANTSIANASNTLAVAGTAQAAVASALTGRKYLYLYNTANTTVYLGASGVTAANGFPLSPGSYMELRAGAAVSPFFVGQASKTPSLASLELS